MALLGQNEFKWLFEIMSMFIIDKMSTRVLRHLSAITDEQSSRENWYVIVWNTCGLWTISYHPYLNSNVLSNDWVYDYKACHI